MKEEAEKIRNKFLLEEITSEEALWQVLGLFGVSKPFCDGWDAKCTRWKEDAGKCYTCDDNKQNVC